MIFSGFFASIISSFALNLLLNGNVPATAASPTECEVPAVPHAEIVTSDDYSDYGVETTVKTGDYISIQCYHGYTSAARTNLYTCENGTWSPQLPTCTKVPTEKKPSASKCKLPQLLYGIILSGGKSPPEMVPIDSSVTFTCNEGYLRKGAADLTCKPDLQWNTAVPICISQANKTCQIPNIVNSRIQVLRVEIQNMQIRVQPGDEMDIGCVPGFQRVGPRYLKCEENGSWSRQPPVCRVEIYQFGMCFLPQVKDAQYLNISLEDKMDIYMNGLNLQKYQNHSIVTKDSDKTKIQISVGTIVAVRCDTDFKLIGQPVVVCNKSEPVAKFEWPRCQRPNKVEKGSSANVNLVTIGISVAAGIIIILLAVIVGVVIWRRRQQQPAKEQDRLNYIHVPGRQGNGGNLNSPTASV